MRLDEGRLPIGECSHSVIKLRLCMHRTLIHDPLLAPLASFRCRLSAEIPSFFRVHVVFYVYIYTLCANFAFLWKSLNVHVTGEPTMCSTLDSVEGILLELEVCAENATRLRKERGSGSLPPRGQVKTGSLESIVLEKRECGKDCTVRSSSWLVTDNGASRWRVCKDDNGPYSVQTQKSEDDWVPNVTFFFSATDPKIPTNQIPSSVRVLRPDFVEMWVRLFQHCDFVEIDEEKISRGEYIMECTFHEEIVEDNIETVTIYEMIQGYPEHTHDCSAYSSRSFGVGFRPRQVRHKDKSKYACVCDVHCSEGSTGFLLCLDQCGKRSLFKQSGFLFPTSRFSWLFGKKFNELVAEWGDEEDDELHVLLKVKRRFELSGHGNQVVMTEETKAIAPRHVQTNLHSYDRLPEEKRIEVTARKCVPKQTQETKPEAAKALELPCMDGAHLSLTEVGRSKLQEDMDALAISSLMDGLHAPGTASSGGNRLQEDVHTLAAEVEVISASKLQTDVDTLAARVDGHVAKLECENTDLRMKLKEMDALTAKVDVMMARVMTEKDEARALYDEHMAKLTSENDALRIKLKEKRLEHTKQIGELRQRLTKEKADEVASAEHDKKRLKLECEELQSEKSRLEAAVAWMRGSNLDQCTPEEYDANKRSLSCAVQRYAEEDCRRAELQQEELRRAEEAAKRATELAETAQEERLHVLAYANQLQEDLEGHICNVCLENGSNVMLLPCNHLKLCAKCAHTLEFEVRGGLPGGSNEGKQCPVCREPVKDAIRVY